MGAYTSKALSPYALCVCGTSKLRAALVERRVRPMLRLHSKSLMYDGAESSYKALYTRHMILYKIRCTTGNQCNSLRMGVMCDRREVLVSNLAALF